MCIIFTNEYGFRCALCYNIHNVIDIIFSAVFLVCCEALQEAVEKADRDLLELQSELLFLINYKVRLV